MKILKTSAGSSSMVIAADSYSQITSGPMSVTADRDGGVFINGPVSFTSQVDNIKIGGIFKLNPLLSTCMPSTMITPIPTLVMDIPIKNLTSMAGIASMLQSIMSGTAPRRRPGCWRR